MCGGTIALLATVRLAPGLSPRVRGNPPLPSVCSAPLRSIPACAGEPTLRSSTQPLAAVYPRVCGGTAVAYAVTGGFPGLSPRVRGNQFPDNQRRVWTRSIPACAGEPHSRARTLVRVTVYPRVCGGTSSAASRRLSSRGLSPRVRGNLMLHPQHILGFRSIPACAGEPGPVAVPYRLLEVYPRVCGGTRLPVRGDGDVQGLSPRVRGNLGRKGQIAHGNGSIPACAGEPVRKGEPECLREVYPRVCGGTVSWHSPLSF